MSLPILSVSGNEPTSLASRGRDLVHAGEFLDMFQTILSNPFEPDSNPTGFIKMGTVENVSFKLRVLCLNRH